MICARLLRAVLLAVVLVALGWLVEVEPARAATIQVTTPNDEFSLGSEIGFGCSLREAIEAANTNTDVGGCVGTGAYTSPDQITFAASTDGQAITLGGNGLTITTNIQITGNGARQTIVDGNHAVRPFAVDAGDTLDLASLTIRNGAAGGNDGGGILNQGTVNVTGSAITGNTTDGSDGGGGIYNSNLATLSLTSTILSGNSAGAGSGGGLFNSGTVTITNSTISGNSATRQGGGIFTTGSVSIAFSTVSNNSAPTALGIRIFSGGTLLPRATILSRGSITSGDNCSNSGTVTSQGSNRSDDNTCVLGGSGDQVVPDMKLGPLADNGGPTLTHALLDISPALDAVIGACPVTADQRGISRPKDGLGDSSDECDIGAYEHDPGRLRFGTLPPLSVGESVGTVTITVERFAGGADAVGATVSASGAATATSDFTGLPAVVTLAHGENSKTVHVTIVDDTLDEPDETVGLTLTDATGGTRIGSPSSTSFTIVDNDSLPSISIDSPTGVVEGNNGTKTIDFSVTLSNGSSQAITVDVATVNGTATTTDGDYVAIPTGTLTWNPEDAAPKTISVTVNGDSKREPDETFTVVLSNPGNATIAAGQGTGTIVNDDPVPSLAIGDVTVAEGNTGTINATFTVTMTGSTSETVTVVAQTADGTATTGSDYTPTGPTTLTFAPGVPTQTFTVPVLGDTLHEPNETVLVNLTGPVNATVSKAQGVGTIQNDDAAPSLAINDVTVSEGNVGTTNATFTVTLTGPTSQTVTVVAQSADGTATAGSDYIPTGPTILTFTPGVTTQTFTVPVVGDTTSEPNETFLVNLTGATNATLGKAQGTGTMQNDDAAAACSSNPALAMDVRNTGDGRLQVTVTAGNPGPNGANRLIELRFLAVQAGTNGLVDVAGQTGRSGQFTVALPDRPTSVTFFVRRATPGQATTVPFEVVHDCGTWRTFVGGGPGSGF